MCFILIYLKTASCKRDFLSYQDVNASEVIALLDDESDDPDSDDRDREEADFINTLQV